MLLQMELFHSFLCLSNVPLRVLVFVCVCVCNMYIYRTFFIHSAVFKSNGRYSVAAKDLNILTQHGILTRALVAPGERDRNYSREVSRSGGEKRYVDISGARTANRHR